MDSTELNRIITKTTRNKQHGKTALIFVTCIVVVVLWSLLLMEQSTHQTEIKWRLTRAAKKIYRNITVLMWETFFDEHLGQEVFDFCPELNCRLTYNRESIAESAAVVFPDRSVNLSDLPERRLPSQHFVFFVLESPYHVSPVAFKNLSSGFYTLTMTYRRDSDVHLPYGFFKPVLNPPSSTFWESLKERVAKKRKLAVWFVSNCRTPSRREDYVRELRRYMDLDIYGYCGRMICPSYGRDCLHRVVSKDYKFYIAFENSVCTDYVTEKYFDRLDDYVVPVVFGRKIYETAALNNSFIAADDFDSPKELAEYLKYLNSNIEAYLSYFKWRQHFVSAGEGYRYTNGFCKLCRLLHDEEPSRIVTASQTAKDLVSWYKGHGTCHYSYGLRVHKL